MKPPLSFAEKPVATRSCAACKKPVAVTQTLLEFAELANQMLKSAGDKPIGDDMLALCDECHRARRVFHEKRGIERQLREQELWRQFRAGKISEENLLDAVADKASYKELIERRKRISPEKKRTRDREVFGE